MGDVHGSHDEWICDVVVELEQEKDVGDLELLVAVLALMSANRAKPGSCGPRRVSEMGSST